jgi:hypothetical protein
LQHTGLCSLHHDCLPHKRINVKASRIFTIYDLFFGALQLIFLILILTKQTIKWQPNVVLSTAFSGKHNQKSVLNDVFFRLHRFNSLSGTDYSQTDINFALQTDQIMQCTPFDMPIPVAARSKA